MKNAVPKNTASIRLYFRVRSLDENDGEQGYAHFVEHMAFNGSLNIPEGELIKILQRQGLEFGFDANASTYSDKTIYMLELPHMDGETLNTALMLLSEIAKNLSFDEMAVRKERGVILSEYDVDDSDSLDVYHQQLEHWLPGSRTNEHFPIDTKNTISMATGKALRTFYEAFYRPENAFLVIVGDVKIADIENSILEHFEGWLNKTKTRNNNYDQPHLWQTSDKVATYTAIHKDRYPANTQLGIIKPCKEWSNSWEEIGNYYKISLANHIFKQRINKIARTGEAPFTNIYVSYENLYDEAMLAMLSLNTSNEDAIDATAVAEQELRKMLIHGFTINEIKEHIANFLVGFKYDVNNANKRHNRELANAILNGHHNGYKILHPENELAIFESAVKNMTANDLTKVFREVWFGENKYLIITGDHIKDAETKLKKAIIKSMKISVTAPINHHTPHEFAYNNFGPSGEIDVEETILDPEVTKVRYKNNVLLNIKKTTNEDVTARMIVRFGRGIVSFPKELAGIEMPCPIVLY
ncbi:MAG: insulinase family protein [Piscirickettsiaceae bacterium]|nr:insulinase family protein [Piscirickettsiaceae bacterium]